MPINLNIEDVSLFSFHYPIPMRWSDMDEMRHVNNAKYLTFLEDGRGRYLVKACKWNWQKQGIILANCNIDYIKPVYFTDFLELFVRVNKIGNKSFEMQYLFIRTVHDEVEVVARATSVQVMFDYQTQQSTEIPLEIKEALLAFEDGNVLIS